MALQLLGEAALSELFQTLFQGLSTIFHKSLSLFGGVNQELEKLQHELSRIRGVLNDAERKRTTDEGVSSWLDDLRDLAYDMEDIIDEMNTERIRMEVQAKKHQVSRFLSPLKDKYVEVMFNKEIIGKIEEVVGKFSEIAKIADALGLREVVGTFFIREQTTSVVDNSEVHGRFEDKKNVIKMLLEENGSKKNYDIMSIVGTGGIGKTTLAQLVFNDTQFGSNFDGQSWACVSDVYDVAKVTKQLLERFTGNSCTLTSLGALQVQLQKMLKGKKFFIVLDDVWTTKEWDLLKGPLSQCGRGSKILITTRSRNVARAISRREPYEVGTLDEGSSWEVFKEKAFSDKEENIDERLVDIGNKIVKKCGGFPLAIKVIGAILLDATIEKWESILNSELWESVVTDNEISPALRLSYHILPSHLKRCFEYLSLFPTDHYISTYELVRMWIAEGFVDAKGGRLLEDVGNEYYKDLQNRCLIQMDGRMHDLVHSLACLVSGNFHCRVTKSSQMFTSARRYSFSGTRVEKYDLNSIPKAKGIRTLLVFGCRLLPLGDQFSEWKFMRVLDLSSSGLMDLPNSIDYLRHLRYLNLSTNKGICHLPDTICNLYNLQVLLLKYCHGLERVPDCIGDLINLVSIQLSCAPISTLPDSICQLARLEKLEIEYCKNLAHLPVGIGKLSNLRHLSLQGLRKVKELPESMWHLHQLQKLDISECTNLVHLPNDLGNLSNLRILRCENTQFTLPDSIVSICGLQELSNKPFSFNAPTKLPPHIGRLTNIQCLAFYSVGKDEGRGIGELRYLNKIKGMLIIANLDNISSVEEATMADLKSKKYIDKLVLRWSDIPNEYENDGEVSDIKRDKELEVEILQALQPHATSLAHLSLENYLGDRFPKWMLDGQLPLLQSLRLNSLNNMIKIDLGLPSLKDLSVTNCPNLKEISIVTHNLRDLALQLLPFLTSLTDHLKFSDPSRLAALRNLRIHDCELLRSLGIERATELSSLQFLCIHSCENLESLFKDGRLPGSLNRLSCVDCPHLNFIIDRQGMEDMKHLIELEVDYSLVGMELQAGGLPANLNDLEIHGRMTDIISMPPSCFCNVASSLKSLTINDFPNLASLPNNLHDMGSLTSLYLIKCPQLVSFPSEGLPLLLEWLSIEQCDKLLFLPTNIYKLQRLDEICVQDCPLLQARPDDRLPPNLQSLFIIDCPKLENQLQEEAREDWLSLM